MAPELRPSTPADVEALFDVRAATRDFPLSRAALAEIGITPESTVAALASGNVKGWVCTDDSRVVGFCMGDCGTGEVLALAVLPQYEGRGIGRRLLSSVVQDMHAAGCARIWLGASRDSAVRAHGFYRSLGWQPKGAHASNGDEILEPTPR